ncbi:MAG: SMC family ATPase [Dehalococcoidia bacterium]
MIPISVRMCGWMRYRDEQVADFGGARLIAICGENGAGKSSIFDAITFALYGKHRLGKVGTEELISQDRDRASVEFEFEEEGQRFMVRRSRGKKAGERDQGLWLWDEGAADWTPVSGTEKEEGLRRSLDQIVRLTPEAFTSSFMLQQGAATEFLDAQPKERFQIISSLIGLKEYEALEKAARDGAKVEDQRLKDMLAKLGGFDGFDGVDDGAVERARHELACATQREAEAAQLLDAARALLANAQRYARLAADVEALVAQIASADELLGERGRIEADAKAFEQTVERIEGAGRVESALADASRAEAAAQEASERASAIDVEALAAELAVDEQAAKGAEGAAKKAEREHAAASQTERAAHEFAVLAAAILAGRDRVAQCEQSIASYEKQLDRLPVLAGEARTLRAIAEALPALRVLKEAREQVEKLGKDEPRAVLDALAAERKRLARDAQQAAKGLAAAEQALAAARKASAEAQALLASLEAQLAGRKASAKESTCSRCGQPVTAAHARKELARLTTEIAAAKTAATAAAKGERAGDAAMTSARDAQKRVEDASLAIERRAAEAEGRIGEYQRAQQAVAERAKAFVSAGPAELTQQVDPAAPAKAIAGVIAAHGDVPKRAQAATKELEQLRGVEGQLVAVRSERERATSALTADESKLNGRLKQVASAEQMHDAARLKLTAAEEGLGAARDAADAARASEVSAREALNVGREQRLALESEAKRLAEEGTGHRRTASAFAQALGELAEAALVAPADLLAELRAQQRDLAGAPARKTALDRAVQDRAAWEGQRAAKEVEVASIPEAHRVEEDVAREVASQAEASAREAREARDASQRLLSTLEARVEELRRLRADREAAERRLKLLRKLQRLLGKSGLQGVLVTDALNHIASHANAFLQRLTGGSLQLSLHRGETSDALELQAVDATCMREPRTVRALSGSQKFRCAVAIASGIGQYVGAGGMRSIVIDEGFGSLDEEGQASMVQELKDLSAYMDRVIVVSHLQDFKDPVNFPDQIMVERAGEGSRITRRVSA